MSESSSGGVFIRWTLFVLVAGSLYQARSASVTGRVTDATGAVIPGVGLKVTILQLRQHLQPELRAFGNTPFRMYKHWVHEGGIASPLIARWPKQIKSHGAWTHQAGHVIDVMATCLDAAGAAYPKTYNGHAITPLEGRSLLPALRQPKQTTPRIVFWEHEGNRAVIEGDWKLVSKGKSPWELYNLAEDRIETKDHAPSDPTRGKKMETQYDAWAARSQVVPWDKLNRTGEGN